MNLPTLEQIESIVNNDYRPLTREQAIKMTYWAFRNEMNKEETKRDVEPFKVPVYGKDFI